MALVVKDRVKEATTTSGTGTLTLSGAVAGFQAFASALSNGDTTYYAIFESSSGAWEVGLGTWATGSSTLARTAVFDSSSGGSAVSLSGSGAEVFITQPASKATYFDGSGDLTLNQDPTAALQAATKQYVDTIAAAGIHYHDPVRVEKEGNLTATYDNGTSGVGATLTNSGTQATLVIDGVTLSTNDRVLVYEQTDASQNGIYTVTNTGSASTNWVLTRATDADSYGPSDPDALGQGDAFFVQEGAAGAGETYVMNTEGTITFGTTDITFSQFSSVQVYSAGAGLTLTGTTFAAGAGTGVTVNANDIAIGQDVGTSADVTFNTVAADLTGDVTGNASTAFALQTARNIALTGAVTGSTSFDGSGNVSITTTATSDPTITLGGDLSGSVTLTNLGNGTLTATINANSVALGTDTTGDYVASVVAGTAIDVTGSGGEGSAATVNLDLSELSTSTTDGDGDFFVVVDTANAQRKLTKGNINISGFNNDAGYTTNVGDITGVTAGNALTGGGTSGTVTINHADTSTQGSVNNSSGTVIQDVTLDTYGHVTGLTSYNLDGRYYTETEADGRFLRSNASDTATGVIYFQEGLSAEAQSKDDITTRTASGFWQSSTATIAEGWPQDSNQWYHLLASTHDNGSNYYSMQFAGSFYNSTDIYYRSTAGSGTASWNKIWNAGNDGSGSGLDADLLDGVQGSNYLRSDTSDTLNGDLTVTGDIFIEDSAIVFNNEAGAVAKINNNGGDLYFHSDANFKFFETDSDVVRATIDVNNGRMRVGDATAPTNTLEVAGVAFAESLQEDYDALSGTTPTIDADLGGAFSLSTSGNTTFTFSAVTSGRGVGFVLEVTAGGTHTLTWPASVKWAGGTAPDAPASGETNIYVFYTRNGGTTWYGAQSIDAAA